MPIDRFGRNIHYLRISLTDACNLRCVYCMPEDMTFRPRSELLQDDEIIKLVQVFAEMGFDKYRLTGGEPTVRANIVDLVRAMKQIPGVGEVSMTTNGILLGKLAKPLKEAGLARCNISVDTLDPERFRAITRWGKLDKVLEGIQAAEDAGLLPIKINTVVARGFNEDDVVELARLTLEHDWQIRYIEMMPFGEVAGFAQSQIVTQEEVMGRIAAEFGPLTPVNNGKLQGEARVFRLPGGRGTVGFISSVTEPFCAVCTRARLTADGRLRLCLLREGEVDLMTPLRAGATVEELKQIIRDAIWVKPWGHGLEENIIPTNRVMSQIGG
ncbi:MAG: GTP 3',8-cyclase MoaA [Aggregatilineales bacterium]|nr:GTP 3',8-cyclase MoaA [Chloroflexota bacterium]HOA23318.1 GTP 3',8-cyclase MoaA [Aggregatilineales bacterium]HPV06073.1 GTP 3',8-cyclase MoaA [Aggregatilineales bacterium]HQE17799.1 GTP 3',8-cyclase MoaA [Aggregatilineales bacterium]